MSRLSYQATGVFLALVGSLLFSTKAVFVKLAYRYEVDSLSLLLLRMSFALPIYLVAIFLSRDKIRHQIHHVKARYWAGLLVAASLGYYLSSLLDFMGLQYIDASVERLILFIYPTFIALLAFLFFRERITGRQWVALLLSYGGLVLVFGRNLRHISLSSEFWLGAILIIICALSFACFMILCQWLIPKFGVPIFTSLSMSVASLLVIVHYTAIHSWSGITMHALPVYLYALAMATLATVIPSYIVNYAIERIGATRAAILASVGPISTISLAYWLLRERLLWIQILGAVMIIVGVTVVSIEMKRQKSK